MRLSVVLAAVCKISATPLAGESRDEQWDSSQKFWDFAVCVVDRQPAEVKHLLMPESLMAGRRWSPTETGKAQLLASRNADCGDIGYMRADSSLMRSTLAAASFVRKHRDKPLPEYSAVPFAITPETIANVPTEAGQKRLILLGFADCVFRTRPEAVRSLLTARPFSQNEAEQWRVLNPLFGVCLPANEGAQARFSPVQLRSLLGEAAYPVDYSLEKNADAGEAVH